MTDFRNLQVKRDKKYEEVPVKLLMDQGLFRANKDLMVTACLVGLSENKRLPLGKDTIQIFLNVYESDGLDGFIYLAALRDTGEMDCVSNEKVRDSVKIFEEYCNGGLEIIRTWLEDNPTDVLGVETVFEKLAQKLTVPKEDEPVNNDDLALSLD